MSDECSEDEYDNVSEADIPKPYRYNGKRAIKRFFGKPKAAEPVDEKMEQKHKIIIQRCIYFGRVPDIIVRSSTDTTEPKWKDTLSEKIMERKRRLIEWEQFLGDMCKIQTILI